MAEIHLRTCSLCEAMCGLSIEHAQGRIRAIKGDPDDPHSRGHICPKGNALQDLHEDPDRLRVPLRRQGDDWQEVDWDEAYAFAAERLLAVQRQHGQDAVGMYIGNPTVHSHGALLGLPALRKSLRTRSLFSASSVDQWPHQFVSHFMFGHQILFPIPDLDRCGYLLMLGANPAASGGSLLSAGGTMKRMEAIASRGGKTVCVDPRRTESAVRCSEHLFITPGSDALLLVGLLKVILEEDLARPDRLKAMSTGWQLMQPLFADWPMEGIAEVTGISAEDIARLAREFAGAKCAACYGRMGVSTQEFGALCQWLIQLLNIVTGNLDRPGGVMFSTPAIDTPARSSRGHFDRYRSRVRGLPEFLGEFPAAALAEEIRTPGEGQVRALITHAGNPVLSTPNGRQLDEALQGLDFMVSIDFYLNETTRHADLILPPVGPLERAHYDLVFNIFAVRNVARYSPALFEPGPDARTDWEILRGLAREITRQGLQGEPLLKRGRGLVERLAEPLVSPERILDMGLRSGPYGQGMRPLSGGLGLKELKKHPHGKDLGPLQRCLPDRLFTHDKRIDLLPAPLVDDLERLRDRYLKQGSAAPAGAEASLLLIGRRDLRSNNSWMHNSPRLVKGKPRCTLWVHPEDAERRGIVDGEVALLRGPRGELQVPVHLTPDIKPGVVSLPHGWGHDRPGVRLRTAQAHAGVSFNDITDETLLDALCGNAAVNGVPVQLQTLEVQG